MKSRQHSAGIDHYLVARAQANATGATAHDVYKLLGLYYGLAADDDPESCARLMTLEERLRSFCQNGRLDKETS